MLQGILTATRNGDILSASLIPSIQETTDSTRTMIPNILVGTYKTFFAANRINWWKSPAESPDLNPIEKVWGSMKIFLQNKQKPRNMPELKEGIKLFWQMMTPKVCSKYIDHLQKVMPDVIKVDGAPSGH